GRAERLDLAAGAHDERRVVTGVGVLDATAPAVEHGEEGGGVLLARRALEEEARHAGANLRRRLAVLDRRRRQRLDRGGEQRRRHALAGDVGEQQHALGAVFAQRGLVEVAGDVARGHVARAQLEAGECRQLGRDERLLDAAGERQLFLQHAALRRLLLQRHVAQPDRRHRGERDEELHVLLAELTDRGVGGEEHHADRRPALGEQRRRHQRTDAGGEQALRAAEARVALRVEHQRRDALLGHFLRQPLRGDEPRLTAVALATAFAIA